jgi:hypothetical protein
MWAITWSNTVPPYDEIVSNFQGATNQPAMGTRSNSQGGGWSNGFFFGFKPWYIRDPLDPFNAPFGGWARDNIVLTFRGGGTFAGSPIADLPDDPTTVTLELWLRNTSESTVDYTVNARSFWYPNQTDPNFNGIDPRAVVPAGRDPWSATAVVASAADGLPTESLSAADSATVDSSNDISTWYQVDIDITASYRAATQWWRDTARPTEQHVQYVISMDALQPTAADITNNLTNLFGSVTEARWNVAADAHDLIGTPPGSAGHPFPTLSFT